MPTTCIVLEAQDLVRLNEGSKTQIMGELWRRYSEAVERTFYGQDPETESQSSKASTREAP